MPQPHPRSTIRRTVKAHSGRTVGRDVDVLIYLDYILFLQTLMKEATIDAKLAGEKKVGAKSVKRVTEDTLRKFRG